MNDGRHSRTKTVRSQWFLYCFRALVRANARDHASATAHRRGGWRYALAPPVARDFRETDLKDVFRTLDLNLLRVFAALMAEGSVTRAARRLALSQPAVSNALNRLRGALDDVLFEKVPFGVRPTVRARELWSAIQPHFDAMGKAISPQTFEASIYDGSLTLAMSDYTVERVMPRLAVHLGEHAPLMRLDLVQYSVSNLTVMFEREGVDLAIGAYLNDTSQSSGIRTHELWPIHSSCLMRRNHPLAKGHLTLRRFLAARHVDVRLPGMNMPLYDSLLAAHGLRRNVVLTLNHYIQTLAVLEQSDCIGVLPTSLIDASPYAERLISKEPPIAMPVRPLGTIWHQRRDADPAHQWLREAIVSLFARRPGDVDERWYRETRQTRS